VAQADPAALVRVAQLRVDPVQVDPAQALLVRVDLVRERGLDRARRVVRERLRKRLCRARTRV
jgi:hypothetical protein